MLERPGRCFWRGWSGLILVLGWGEGILSGKSCDHLADDVLSPRHYFVEFNRPATFKVSGRVDGVLREGLEG